MSTPVVLSVQAQSLAMLPLNQRVGLESLATRLQTYAETMKPGAPVDPRVGGTQQMALWNAIRGVMRAKPEEFNSLYSELLMNVHQFRTTVFSERYAFRFFSEMTLASADRMNFERVLNLLMATCNPGTRRMAARQTDLKAVLRGFNDESLVERMLAYYAM